MVASRRTDCLEKTEVVGAREPPPLEQDYPSFSIIVPTYQRRDSVCDALHALFALTYPGPVEIIVVVDGSKDGTAAALAQLKSPFPMRVIEQPNGGAGSARNRGADEAYGDILLFIDDDMICEPDLIEQHAKMYRCGADAVTGEVFLDAGSRQNFITDGVARWISLPRPQSPQLPFHVYTGQLSVRRSVFNKIGGFDESFTIDGVFGHEDTDFGVKLLARYALRHSPDAVTYQRYLVGPADSMKRAKSAAAADVRFLARYPQFADYVLEQRGSRSWKSRLIFLPLSRLPFFASVAGSIAVRVAEVGVRTRFRSSRLLSNFFFAARAITYWSAARANGGYPSSRSLLILCYHAINDQSDDPVLAPYGVPPARFSAQLKSLARRGFVFVGPDALAAFVREGARLPRRAVILTFDDCYEDLLDVARAVLHPSGIQAIAFTVTGTSGTNEWDQAHGAKRLRLLAREELHALSSLGVEIGAHSRTHRLMPQLSPGECELETRGASSDLAAAGLPQPRFFAYPYGASDEASIRAVRDSGYLAAFGVHSRRADLSSEPFDLPRVPILASDNGWRFHLKTAHPRVFEWADLNLRRASKVLGYVGPTRLA